MFNWKHLEHRPEGEAHIRSQPNSDSSQWVLASLGLMPLATGPIQVERARPLTCQLEFLTAPIKRPRAATTITTNVSHPRNARKCDQAFLGDGVGLSVTDLLV
jgi:hypothetical protein